MLNKHSKNVTVTKGFLADIKELLLYVDPDKISVDEIKLLKDNLDFYINNCGND